MQNFYMNQNKSGDFQICISVPLRIIESDKCQITGKSSSLEEILPGTISILGIIFIYISLGITIIGNLNREIHQATGTSNAAFCEVARLFVEGLEFLVIFQHKYVYTRKWKFYFGQFFVYLIIVKVFF